MKKFLPLLFILLLSSPMLRAQIPVDEAKLRFGGRTGLEIDRKVNKHWQVQGDMEIRGAGKMVFDERLLIGIGTRYDIDKHYSVAARYRFIEKRAYRTDLSSRHRFSLQATGGWKAGSWRFSAREELRLQHRPGTMDPFKHPRNEVFLLTRAQAGYKINRYVAPFLRAEGRFLLNGPRIDGYAYQTDILRYTTPEGNLSGAEGWFFSGYRHTYLNRIRIEAGADFRTLLLHDTIRLYMLADRTQDFHVKTNEDATSLTGLWWEQGWLIGFGLRYSFKL